jgi:hypothetical protein
VLYFKISDAVLYADLIMCVVFSVPVCLGHGVRGAPLPRGRCEIPLHEGRRTSCHPGLVFALFWGFAFTVLESLYVVNSSVMRSCPVCLCWFELWSVELPLCICNGLRAVVACHRLTFWERNVPRRRAVVSRSGLG